MCPSLSTAARSSCSSKFCESPALPDAAFCSACMGDLEEYLATTSLREVDPKVKPANEVLPRAPDFLRAALQHMDDRAATYDKPEGERSMGATVAMFNALTGHSLSEAQGWKFMVCLKLVRSEQGAYREDNYEDGAAYFGLAGEAAGAETKQPTLSL